MNSGSIRDSQILFVIVRIKNRGEAVVDGLYEFAWLAGDDGKGSFPLMGLRVLPRLPNACYPEGLLAKNHDLVLGLLSSMLDFRPFKNGVGGDDAAPLEKRVFPALCLVN